MLSDQLIQIYDLLFARFGRQHWWPGDISFEIVIGVTLTQNTNLTNIEKTTAKLDSRGEI